MIKFYVIYTACVSALTLILFALDKLFSKLGTKRIPEFVLLFFTSVGGSVGALIGMYGLRHKTSMQTKFHFAFGSFFAFAIQVTVFIILVMNHAY